MGGRRYIWKQGRLSLKVSTCCRRQSHIEIIEWRASVLKYGCRAVEKGRREPDDRSCIRYTQLGSSTRKSTSYCVNIWRRAELMSCNFSEARDEKMRSELWWERWCRWTKVAAILLWWRIVRKEKDWEKWREDTSLACSQVLQDSRRHLTHRCDLLWGCRVMEARLISRLQARRSRLKGTLISHQI